MPESGAASMSSLSSTITPSSTATDGAPLAATKDGDGGGGGGRRLATFRSQMNGLLVRSIFAAVLGMFQFGFNTGVINAPQESIQDFIEDSYADRSSDGSKLSDQTVSFLFSLAVCACLVGGMIGGLSAGYVADKLGRKRGLWYAQFLSIAGGILMGVCKPANSYELLFLGRLLIGLACGFFTGLVPTYITEISPVALRGAMGTCNQLAVTVGILSSQVLGLNVVLGSDERWPWLLALGGVVPAALQLAMLPFVPESPRYDIINLSNDEKGLNSLVLLRTSRAEAEKEHEDMRQIREESKADTDEAEKVTLWQVLTHRQYRLPLMICVLMHLSQQLSGMVAIFYYSTKFFVDAGVAEENAQYATLGVGAIMVVMTLVTIPLMDRLGRRTLHLTGLGGIVFFCALIIVASNLDPNSNEGIGVFLIVSTLGFVVFFALGPGSIPWLITGELFTQGPRPAATAIATVVNWTANLAVGLTFPYLAESDVSNFSFLPFGVISAVLLVVLWFYLPETKGRTTEEITAVLTGSRAWRGRYSYGSSESLATT